MILKNLSIQKYRSLFDVSFDVQGLNIIVGGNDSGKSNILRCIRTFLQPHTSFGKMDYSMFPRLGGSGSVTDNPITINGQFTLNHDAGSDVANSVIANLSQISAVKRNNDSYIMDYTYISNGRPANSSISIDAKAKALLPKVVSIDLADAYKSLEDGALGDLVVEINQTIKELPTEEDKRSRKTLLNSIIKESWNSDNNSSVSISSTDGEIEIECSDNYSINTSLGQRGTGFQAFLFSLLKILNAVFKANSEKYDLVILIEEPERMLHPQGQSDYVKILRRMIDENKNAIIFVTTHSPIIVRTDHSANILLVEKNREGKSVVNAKPHINNWKALRDSLGMRPSDSMLIGDITVIVEGACEQVFLPKLMQKYCNIDISVFNFVSAEGVTNVSYYTKIIRDMNTRVIAIFDNDELGRKKRQDLINAKLIDETGILTYPDIDNREIAFEDLFPPEYLFEAVENVYNESMKNSESEVSSVGFEQFCANNKTPDYTHKCWATKMSEYLVSQKVLEHKKDFDKFSICKFCIEKTDSCPEQIMAIFVQLKEIFLSCD